MAVPVVRIQFDANPPQATEFVLDVSALDDAADSLADSPRWIQVDTVDTILSGSITVGRQQVDQPVQAGSMTLVCDNRSGNFDPDNDNSAFNQAGNPYLVKGMLARAQVTFGVSTVTLFTGRLEDVQLSKARDLQATLTFVDDLAAAGGTAMTSYNDAVRPETTLSRATWLVGLLSNLTATPNVSANLTRDLLPTYGGGSVLDMLNTVVTAEAGRVFVDPSGALQVLAHQDDLVASAAPIATLTDADTGIDYEVLDTSSARMQVVNGCILDRYNRNDSNFPSVYGGDGNSAALYGQTVISVVAPLADDGDAQGLATYYGTRRARPAPGIDAVQVNFTGQTDAAIPTLLAATLGDALMVHRTVGYTTGAQVIDMVALIEGIRWDFPDVSKLFGQFYLFPADVTSLFGGAGAFTLDTSALDGADVLAAY